MSNTSLLERYLDLEATAAYLADVNEVKDLRIKKLEAEITVLRKRVARLSRKVVDRRSLRNR
jgi:hypothetical protein